MSTQVTAKLGRWPAYVFTFLTGAAMAKVMPAANSLGVTGQPDAGSRFNAIVKIFHPMDANAAILLAAAVLMVAAAVAARFGVYKRLAAGVADFGGAGASSGISGSFRARKDAKAQNAVRDQLEEQLGQLVKLMSGYLESSSTQSEALAEIRGKLETATTVEQIQTIVELLANSSAQSQKDAEALRGSLREAQKQTVALRLQLTKVEKLAALDPLTNLPNRRSFQDFLEAAVVESHADYTPLTVIMTDIDHFKKVNDGFGHATGDAVLRQFSKILSGSVRSTDMVARYGGEEFVIVLKKTPVGNAVQVVERIQSNIRAAGWLEPGSGPNIGGLTASFGVAEILDHETAARLIERADQRLYAAKKAGRNRAVWTSAKA